MAAIGSDFKMLSVSRVLARERRRGIHFNVTEHSTVEWAAIQITQAFPWKTVPRHLLRDRDRMYGDICR